MSLIFMDSFDHYLDLTTNYDSVFQSAINTGGTARTGNGCLEILSGAFGPGKTIPVTLDCLMASSFWCSTGTNSGAVYAMGNEGGGVAYWQGVCVAVELNNDGSFTCIRGPSAGNAPLVSSAPGLFHFSNYNALALRVTVGINGSIKLWCNGQLVINATGLDTRNLHNPGNSQIDAVSLLGPGGNAFNAYHDDYSKEMILSFQVLPDRIELALRDFGVKCEPGDIKGRNLDDIRPGGLGVHIIRGIMDRVEYDTRHAHGTELRLTRFLSRETGETDPC